MSNPLLSVIVPAYNSAATIRRALESVVSQDYAPVEIIVIDDCSSDETRDIVRAFRPAVRLVEQPVNGGASRARNAGINAALGDYVAFLDSDDAWEPSKASKQMAAIHGRDCVTVVTCDSVFRDSAGRCYKRSHQQNPPAEGLQAWRELLANNFIPTPTVLCRRDDVLELGGFDPQLPVAEDLDLWIRLALCGEVAVVREVLVEVFEQPGSLLTRYRRAEAGILMGVIERHLDAQKDRMTVAEIRSIRGRRYFKLGANSLAARRYAASVRPFLISAGCGVRPFRSVFNVVRAAVCAPVSRGTSASV